MQAFPPVQDGWALQDVAVAAGTSRNPSPSPGAGPASQDGRTRCPHREPWTTRCTRNGGFSRGKAWVLRKRLNSSQLSSTQPCCAPSLARGGGGGQGQGADRITEMLLFLTPDIEFGGDSNARLCPPGHSRTSDGVWKCVFVSQAPGKQEGLSFHPVCWLRSVPLNRRQPTWATCALKVLTQRDLEHLIRWGRCCRPFSGASGP